MTELTMLQQAPAPPAPPTPDVVVTQGGDGAGAVLTADGKEVRIHPDGRVTIDGEPVTAESQMPPFPPGPEVVPEGAVIIAAFFFVMIAVVAIGVPLARAFARRMDRKHVVTKDAAELSGRLDRIEQAIETVAVEVERISEGQRFTARLMNEMQQRQLERVPSGADEPAPGRS